MNTKIKLGILGGGDDSLIGILHRVAASMFDQYQLIGGVFNTDIEISRAFAKKIDLPLNRIYANLDALIAEENKLPQEERIKVISVLTPNFLHFEMAKKLLEGGFHVICEKPLTTTYQEALILQETIKNTNLQFAVTYTYTGYPMVRQMRNMIQDGVIGQIQKIDIQYYQGWINSIIHDKQKRKDTWRLNPKYGGLSCCVGDIGTHAFNMLEYVTQLQVTSLLADLNYLYEDNTMDIDGNILVRCDANIKGIIRTSQIATAEENNFTVSIYGKHAALKWEQENPNYLYLLEDNKPIQILKPGNSYNSRLSLEGTKLPPGHPEGIFDSMGNIYRGFAKAIKKEKYDKAEFPTLQKGVRGMQFIETVLASQKKGNVWVDLK